MMKHCVTSVGVLLTTNRTNEYFQVNTKNNPSMMLELFKKEDDVPGRPAPIMPA